MTASAFRARRYKVRPNETIALANAVIGIVVHSSKYGLRVIQIDAHDYKRTAGFRWHVKPYGRRKVLYANTHVTLPNGTRTTYGLHRLLVGLPDMQVDHRNGNGLDNRRTNLHLVTNQDNQRNVARQVNNTSGFTGVHWVKKSQKWQARITVDGRLLNLGYFDAAEMAARTRDVVARAHGFAERALNYPQADEVT